MDHSGKEQREHLPPHEALKTELEVHGSMYRRTAYPEAPLTLSEAVLLARQQNRDLLNDTSFTDIVDLINWPGSTPDDENATEMTTSVHYPPTKEGVAEFVREIRESTQSHMSSSSVLNNFLMFFQFEPRDLTSSVSIFDDEGPIGAVYGAHPVLARFTHLFPRLAAGLRARVGGCVDAQQGAYAIIANEYEAGDDTFARAVLYAHGIMQRLLLPGDMKTQYRIIEEMNPDAAPLITDTSVALSA